MRHSRQQMAGWGTAAQLPPLQSTGRVMTFMHFHFYRWGPQIIPWVRLLVSLIWSCWGTQLIYFWLVKKRHKTHLNLFTALAWDIKFELPANPTVIAGCYVPSNTSHFQFPKLISLYKLWSSILLYISYVDLQYEIDYSNYCAKEFPIDYSAQSCDSWYKLPKHSFPRSKGLNPVSVQVKEIKWRGFSC